MRDGSKKKTKKVGLVRRVGGWIGGALAIGALLVVLYLLGMQMYNPRVDSLPVEAEVTVEALLDEGATAQITLEGRRVSFPLTGESSEPVTVGTRLHVTYTKAQSIGSVTVQEWRVATADEPSGP
jgi:hypothetical protein